MTKENYIIPLQINFVQIEENHYEFSLTEIKMIFDDQTTINVPRGIILIKSIKSDKSTCL